MPFRMQNFVISTTDIWAGDWSDPVPIDFDGLDPSLFFDDEDGGTIKQMQIDLRTGEALSELREIWGGHLCHDTEGPHMYKYGGWYYLLVAEGGTFRDHVLSIARSRSIWGPFESYENNPILTARNTKEPIQNVGHGELFQDASGSWWAAILGGNVAWNGSLGNDQPRLRSLANHYVSLLYIRSPIMSDYILPPKLNETGSDGITSFRLRPSSGTLSSPTGTCTFIGIRQRHFDCTSQVSLVIGTKKDSFGVIAGLSLYKDHLRHLSLYYDYDKREITCQIVNSLTGLASGGVVKTATVASTNSELQTTLKLQIAATKDAYTVSYAQADDGGEWKELYAFPVQDLVTQEMTGPVFGIFSHRAVHVEGQSGRDNEEITSNDYVEFTDFSVDGRRVETLD
ncbi:uncharacterized protein FIESC28_05929 [Fusarium coffeatum]|uniref:Beta-xylosidase C-terminal Concanavalin A-like domain-containing protein n=1 Tax=Fusarium coffeatum TaxID=231269 RepID=A0A366RPE1_9HYPO|nr:uncharacterized protein FIESC28_05929 [Fusarium coffeatum]RBR18652.1 hypothetical protein FIESC28_05929 [Fusarium coffeatum]